MAALMASSITVFKQSFKISNMTDTTDAVRLIKDRIGKDVREGRSLGDVYGTDVTDNSVTPALTMTQGSDQFPCTRDPIYGNGESPPAGWPSTWGSTPYTLSNTCLIVQVPIGDNHNDSNGVHAWNSANVGWPTEIPVGSGSPATSTIQDNVETHVYMVMADPNNPGEYMMQYSCFPGYATTGYDPKAHSISGQTVLTGIIGPLDANNVPKVFQFIDKTDSKGTPQDSITPVTTPSGAFVANFTGVVINLEVRHHNTVSLQSKNISVQPIAFKTEVFLRNNAVATAIGQPSTVTGGTP